MKIVMLSLISPCQTAVVLGHQISDNVMLAQSIFRDYHLKSSPHVAFKLKIHKAFESLNWEFLFKTMIALGSLRNSLT